MSSKKIIVHVVSSSTFLIVISSASLCFAANGIFTPQPHNNKKAPILAYADLAETKKPREAKTGGGEYGISLMDKNKDNKVSKKEFLKYNEAIFDKIDTNRDGSVDKNEADNYVSKSEPKTNQNYSTSHGELTK